MSSSSWSPGPPSGRRAASPSPSSTRRGERETSRERLVHRALAAAVVLLAIVALLLPVYEKRQAVLALHPAVAKAKQEAESTSAVANELDRQVADYNYLIGKKQATPPA